jgi:hypothetical protein
MIIISVSAEKFLMGNWHVKLLNVGSIRHVESAPKWSVLQPQSNTSFSSSYYIECNWNTIHKFKFSWKHSKNSQGHSSFYIRCLVLQTSCQIKFEVQSKMLYTGWRTGSISNITFARSFTSMRSFANAPSSVCARACCLNLTFPL